VLLTLISPITSSLTVKRVANFILVIVFTSSLGIFVSIASFKLSLFFLSIASLISSLFVLSITLAKLFLTSLSSSKAT